MIKYFYQKVEAFHFDIITSGETIPCKPYKVASYYDMFLHFVLSGFNPKTNTFTTGTQVLNLVNQILGLISK